MFQKAEKKKAKLRLTLDGPAGAGKTYSSLQLATALGKKVALLDTEHGSASKYADKFEFDTANLTDHSPLAYVDAIKAAGEAGYEVLVIDSLSHAWTGALEIVDREKDKFGSGWRKVTPMHNKLVESILTFPGHVICTMRSRMAYESEKDSNGRTIIRKVGMAPVQREGMEYEFDVVVDLSLEGNVNISKTRCSDLTDKMFTRRDVQKIGGILKAWLEGGVEAKPEPVKFEKPAKAESRAESKAESQTQEAAALVQKHLGDEDAATFAAIEECDSKDELAALYRSLPDATKKKAKVLDAFKARKAKVG